MRNVFNFSAGPAMLPESVLLKAQEEMLNWQGTGMSIMEIGHRTDEFQALAQKIETELRFLMSIPDNYHVLFLPGGASLQFAMVPINLFSEKKTADYIETGLWSGKAVHEASRFGHINIAARVQENDGLLYIPDESEWQCSPHADYLHYTPNETIAGLSFNYVPKTNVPLVADMTSMIMSEPINVSDFGVIYASAQKNLGQAGITVVIVRDDLIKEPPFLVPTMLQYQAHVEANSFYNTPPTYSWYMLGLMLEWIKEQGGVNAIYAKNCRNAKKLYDLLDSSHGFYRSIVHPSYRSIMNVSFHLRNEELLSLFLKQSHESSLTYLKGHRVAGGIRASIYNAMPEEGVDKIVDFMSDFMKRFA